ncbi:MAG: EAL domain-containing protein, partial [Burkholderiaceae bacterium]
MSGSKQTSVDEADGRQDPGMPDARAHWPLLRFSSRGECTECTEFWHALTGIERASDAWFSAIHVLDRERLRAALARAIADRTEISTTVRVRRPDAVYRDLTLRMHPVDAGDPDTDWLLGSPSPVGQPLVPESTGLSDALASAAAAAPERSAPAEPAPGTALLADRVERQRLSNRRTGQLSALVDCGTPAETAGMVSGRQLASQLAGLLRASDIVMSLPDGRTLVMLNALGKSLDDASFHAGELAAKIVRWLAARHPRANGEFACGLVFIDDGSDWRLLLAQAGEARQQALVLGQTIRYADPAVQQASTERDQLIARLGQALESREFVLQFQPVISARRILSGVEALVRWHAADQRGLRFPSEFIAVAAQSGVIRALGHWVLQEACDRLVQWRGSLGHGVSFSININAAEFSAGDFVEKACDIVGRAGLASGSVQLELPAAVLLAGGDRHLSDLGRLRSAGFGIIFDDYGDDGIDLLALKSLPVDAVKIRAGLVCADTDTDSDD